MFYANRRPEEAAFLEELRTYEEINSNFKLVATMTACRRNTYLAGRTGPFHGRNIEEMAARLDDTRLLSRWARRCRHEHASYA
jgi:hypothetical protein